MILRSVLPGSALAVARTHAVPAAFGHAGAWPGRPARICIPLAPGVGHGVMTDILAEDLQPRLGRPFAVANRTGTGGDIAVEAAAQAAPDGCTIGSVTVGAPSLEGNRP